MLNVCVYVLRISKIMAHRRIEMHKNVLMHLHVCANLNPVTNGKHTKLFLFFVLGGIFGYKLGEHSLLINFGSWR